MNVRHLPLVSEELDDAVDYYEKEQEGLGFRLWLEVESNIQWIARNPEIPRLRNGIYRRVNLKTFPYYISYVIRPTEILVVAIAHVRRRPEYWIKRIE